MALFAQNPGCNVKKELRNNALSISFADKKLLKKIVKRMLPAAFLKIYNRTCNRF
jgi:hypothetical protein